MKRCRSHRIPKLYVGVVGRGSIGTSPRGRTTSSPHHGSPDVWRDARNATNLPRKQIQWCIKHNRRPVNLCNRNPCTPRWLPLPSRRRASESNDNDCHVCVHLRTRHTISRGVHWSKEQDNSSFDPIVALHYQWTSNGMFVSSLTVPLLTINSYRLWQERGGSLFPEDDGSFLASVQLLAWYQRTSKDGRRFV